MSCPVCEQDVDTNHAVEWDCEPAPGSGEWGMSVCEVCHAGIYKLITPWDWVQTVLQRERNLSEDRIAFVRKIANLLDEADRFK